MAFLLPSFPFSLWDNAPRRLKHPRSELGWGDLDFEPEWELDFSAPRVPKAPTNLKLRMDKGGQGWVGQVGLPGIRSKKGLSVDVDKEFLRVFARSPSHTYTHIVSIPEGADTSRIEAEFEDGVLTVAIPRLRKKLKLNSQAEEEKKGEEEKRKEEEAKKLALIEEKKKKKERLLRRLAGPVVSTTETDTQINTTIEYGEPVAKENFDIEVEEGILKVSFNLKDEESNLNFKNLIRLPEGVKDDQISASVEGNCLILSYPKPEKKKPIKIMITDTTETSPTETNETSDSEREKKAETPKTPNREKHCEQTSETRSCESNTVEITEEH